MTARRVGVVAISIVVLAAAVMAVSLPDLPAVHPRVRALRKDLGETHDRLAAERAVLLTDSQKFETDCRHVEVGSPADAACGKRFDLLTTRSLDHCQRSVQFIRDYQQAIAPAITSAQQERPVLIAQLKGLQAQFERQVRSFDLWAEDTAHAKEQAERKLDEIVMASALHVMLSLSEEQLLERVERMVEHAHELKNVKYVKSGELRFFVDGMRKELNGKTASQARGIVLGALDAQRQSVGDMAKVGKLAIHGMSRQVSETADENDQMMFESAYDGVIIGAKLTIAHAPDVLKTLGRAEAALGVIGLAPEAAQVALFWYESYVDEGNIDALDRLRQAADQQRVAVSARLTNSIKDPKALQDLQVKLRADAQFRCSK